MFFCKKAINTTSTATNTVHSYNSIPISAETTPLVRDCRCAFNRGADARTPDGVRIHHGAAFATEPCSPNGLR